MSTNLQDAVNNARLCHKNEIKIYKDCEAAVEEASRRSAGAAEFDILEGRRREQNRVVLNSYGRLLDAMADQADESEKRMAINQAEITANVE